MTAERRFDLHGEVDVGDAVLRPAKILDTEL